MPRISKLLRTISKTFGLSERSLGHVPERRVPYKSWKFVFGELAFNSSGYNKYGLYSHDLLRREVPIIREALRRLPKDVLDARNFRLARAFQLDFLKIHLPEEKWITFEQDLEYRYLQPYLREIKAEKIEIYEFGCVNYHDDDWPANELK
ncbi:hypothetical protein KM043_002893 [Ampulex compressa]|nr:hypothetical protein KM043_002893 [Ampulex compressa]